MTATPRIQLAELDPVWSRIRQEAEASIAGEPLLGGMVHSSVLHHPTFERALAYRIAMKLESPEMPALYRLRRRGSGDRRTARDQKR